MIVVPPPRPGLIDARRRWTIAHELVGVAPNAPLFLTGMLDTVVVQPLDSEKSAPHTETEGPK